MMRTLCLLVIVVMAACSGNPTAPTSQPPPVPPPTPPTLYTVTGLVSSLATSAGIANAVILVADGPNAGLQTTSGSDGRYTLTGLSFAGFSVGVTAPGFVSSARGVPLSATTTTANFALLPDTLWSQSGSGNTVFTMPGYFPRVRIQGRWTGINTSNFIVHIGGRFVVNEILRQTTIYDGIHLAQGGGTVEIINSTYIQWTFTEHR